MSKKIAIFGGSFNPPGIHHQRVAQALSERFDQVLVVPCGPRPDKPTTNDVEPFHRAAMVDLAFQAIPKTEIDLSDLERSQFTPNIDFAERYGDRGEIWHVVEGEYCQGGGSRDSTIHRVWHRGEELWNQVPFCVITHPSLNLVPSDLPPRRMLVDLEGPGVGTSDAIREKVFHHGLYDHLAPREVSKYIKRYGLYRGRIPSRKSLWNLNHPKLRIVPDMRNPKAVALAERYRHFEDLENPDCILVLGGDGTMLHAIRTHWRKRLPFLGINQGHLGFLLNEPPSLTPDQLTHKDLIVRQLPMLYIEAEGVDGIVHSELAFNDAWVERTTSQSAWLEVVVQNQVKIPKMVADGALVCTAGGSTAYARSMGVAPLLADTQGWVMVGSNVMTPFGWKSALLAPDAVVEFRSLGGAKRPIVGFVDGRAIQPPDIADSHSGGNGQTWPLSRFTARLSRTATVELAFSLDHDMAEKISQIQFPPL